MKEFNMLYAGGLFLIYFLIDCFYANYIRFVADQCSIQSANTSVVLTGLGFLGYYEFMRNPYYIIPILAGVWLGTYLTVQYSKKESEKSSKWQRIYGSFTSKVRFKEAVAKVIGWFKPSRVK